MDKRLAEDPTRFGYRSLHYVCTIDGGAAPFEIQVRTLLQHAWAEIEHDLGYKSTESLPHYFRFTQDTWRFSSGDLTAIQQGYGLFFLAHLAMLETPTPELDKVRRIEDFYVTLDGIDDRVDARRIAVRLLEAYRAYRGPGGT